MVGMYDLYARLWLINHILEELSYYVNKIDHPSIMSYNNPLVASSLLLNSATSLRSHQQYSSSPLPQLPQVEAVITVSPPLSLSPL